MFTPVSGAGITIDKQHGLVDCGPRRLDPEADWFRRTLQPACPISPAQPVSPAEPPQPDTPIAADRN